MSRGKQPGEGEDSRTSPWWLTEAAPQRIAERGLLQVQVAPQSRRPRSASMLSRISGDVSSRWSAKNGVHGQDSAGGAQRALPTWQISESYRAADRPQAKLSLSRVSAVCDVEPPDFGPFPAHQTCITTMAMLHFAILLFGRISFPGPQHFYRAPGPRACCLGPKFKLLLEHAIASPLASCLPLPLFERYLLVRMIGSRGASSAPWALVQTRQGANLVLAEILSSP